MKLTESERQFLILLLSLDPGPLGLSGSQTRLAQRLKKKLQAEPTAETTT